MTKTYKVDPVTRLEGHGNLLLQLSNDNKKVENIEFNVTSTRFFEKFCEGRYAEHIARITCRICGICPIPHHLTPTKAVEAAWGVEVPSAAVKLRRLMINAKQYSSHLLHFYALAAPDFLYGPFAPPEKRNVVAVINALPDVGAQALKMMDFGQNICQTIGAKSVHPVTAVPGGMKRRLTEEERDAYLQQVDDQLQMMTNTVNLALDVVNKYWDVVANVAVVPMYYVGVADQGRHDIYWGDLVVCDPDGNRKVFKKENYTEAIGEHYAPAGYASHTYIKSAGYPNGVYTVGPLAMINTSDYFGTPLADSALKEMKSKIGTKVIHHQFAGHWARIIETVAALEQVIKLLKDPEICSDKIKTEHVEAKAGRGVGLSEAPRGALIYDITSDDAGICKKLNLIVATNHNMGGINKVLNASAKQIFEQGALSKIKLPEPILK